MLPALTLTLLAGCGAPPRPSVLLITLDTTRADHLSPYGYSAAQTPTYDRLAAEGTVFTRAYSTAPLTIVSHSTILTGLTPPAHGVRDNGDFVLGAEQVTLAERFLAAGYHTAAFTSAFPTQARWGLGQGFQVYHDPLKRLPTELDWSDQRTADTVVDDAIATLSAAPDGQPAFVWVHLFDAHWPYAPPEPYKSQFKDSPYDGEIAFASDQVGRLLDWWDAHHPDSVVLLTADHGEGLGDGGERTHSFLLHDGTIRVPMILRGHGQLADPIAAGARIDDPVGHTDIAPTLLNLAGIPTQNTSTKINEHQKIVPGDFQGRDLRHGGSAVLYSEAMTPQYNLGLAPLFSLTDGGGRYTEGAYGAWYPVSGDQIAVVPETAANLGPHESELAALRESLGEHDAPVAAMDASALEQLQALGYIGGDLSAEAGDIDPRDVIDLVPLTWRIKEPMRRGQDAVVERMLATLEARMPGAWGIELLRAQAVRGRGDVWGAVQRFTDLYQRSPSPTIALQVGDLWKALGEAPEAESWYREALALQPASPEAMLGLVLSLGAQGDQPEASALSEEFLVAYPDHAELILARASMLLDDGRIDEAADEALWALQRLPNNPNAYLVASEALWQLGEADQAIDLLKSALDMDRRALELRLTLVDWLMEVGRVAEARRALMPAWRLDPDLPGVNERAEMLGLGAR